MKTKTSFRTLTAAVSTVAMMAAATMLTSAATPKFFSDDPVRVERDTQDASSLKPLEVNLFVDLTRNMFSPIVIRDVHAKNVNTVDEVPDSSWFTNRVGTRALTPFDVAVGPDTNDGPAAGVWTITSSKSDGVTPGFTIKDATGERWFLKFDPPGYRGMTTGTEVAVTKLMWALGYFVPENHIASLTRDRLVIGAGATFTPAGGTARAMRADDIDALLRRVSRDGDGSYRVVASRALPGKPVGRIKFAGTRPDDPNDLVPHEDRRELRGYGVFAAWLNHVDAKAINSLDTLITDEGRSYVRHNLVDFGSALGSGGVAPADYWAGRENLVERPQIGRQILGFGFRFPAWHTVEFYEARAIGRLPKDNRSFDPDAWKPRVPNPAFLQARADDKFWAAQKLMAVSTDMIRAAVDAGQFGDAAAEAFLVRALAERRDAIGRTYMTAVNPIADPVLDRHGVLAFRNAAVDAGFGAAPAGYRAVWSAFDNLTGETTELGVSTGTTTRMPAPASLDANNSAFVKVAISAVGSQAPAWERPAHLYFRGHDGAWELVGLERIPR